PPRRRVRRAWGAPALPISFLRPLAAVFGKRMRKSFERSMLPITLRPDGRRALVVGGGPVAARKAETLVAAGYRVFVVAKAIVDERLHGLTPPNEVAVRAYAATDVAGAALAIAATGDAVVDACVIEDARKAGVIACDASDPQRGDFHMPATLRRGDLTVSVDSAGAAPSFSKRVATELAD